MERWGVGGLEGLEGRGLPLPFPSQNWSGEGGGEEREQGEEEVGKMKEGEEVFQFGEEVGVEEVLEMEEVGVEEVLEVEEVEEQRGLQGVWERVCR